MSWFKKEIDNYEVDGAPLTEEEKKNPFMKNVIDESFERITIPLDEGSLLVPTARVAKEVKDGSSD